MSTSRWRRSGFAAKGRAASSSNCCRASVTADSGGSSCPVARLCGIESGVRVGGVDQTGDEGPEEARR